MTPLLSGYFDTTTGPKKEAASYRRIAEEVGVAPGEVCFVSDSADEVRAALAGGMGAALCARDGVPDFADAAVIRSFEEICPEV